MQRGARIANYMLPHETIYKLEKEGKFFIFKPGGILYEKFKDIMLGNDDAEECWYFTSSLQLALGEMEIQDIEAKYGPIEII